MLLQVRCDFPPTRADVIGACSCCGPRIPSRRSVGLRAMYCSFTCRRAPKPSTHFDVYIFDGRTSICNPDFTNAVNSLQARIQSVCSEMGKHQQMAFASGLGLGLLSSLPSLQLDAILRCGDSASMFVASDVPDVMMRWLLHAVVEVSIVLCEFVGRTY